MPLKILYIFLCFVSVHRSLGNGIDDAEQDTVLSLIANQTDSSSIPEISPDSLNVTRRNFQNDGTENEDCAKAITLKKTLKLLISLLNDSTSTNTKTTHVLENLKDLLKNTPAGDVEVMDKIDDLVKTVYKYEEPGESNDHTPLRSVFVKPKKVGFELKNSLNLNLQIPAPANTYCTQQLFNILKATEQAYLNLARNPICDIDVSDIPTLPNINPYLLNPNVQIDVWGKSPNVNPFPQSCVKCYEVPPKENNIVTPVYYPVYIDVNTDKNPLLHEIPDDYSPIVKPNNEWFYYNQLETSQVRPVNHLNLINVIDNYPYGPGPNNNPEIFTEKPDTNLIIPYYNNYPYVPGPINYPDVFTEKPDTDPILNPYGPEPTPYYYPKFIDLNPDKNTVDPYNQDTIPVAPVNPWNENPFPYEVAPHNQPLNPIYPYIPFNPEPEPENEKILPFQITPEVLNFIYPIPNELNQMEFPENTNKPVVPIYPYPVFPPKEIYPPISQNIQQPINPILPYTPKLPIYVKPEPIYWENEVQPYPYPPEQNIPVNPWEIPMPPEQDIPDFPAINPNVPNNLNNIEIFQNISIIHNQPNNQYPPYPFYPPNQNEIMPLPYIPYVPNQLIPPQPLPNLGPLINIFPILNELQQPVEIVGFVREAIEVIRTVVPVVKFDQQTLHIIAEIRNILVRKNEEIIQEYYSTILSLFEKVIEYVQQLEYFKQIKDIIELHVVSNRQKFETDRIVEFTYLVKQPIPVIYYTNYYVKYSMPYRHFITVANNLIRQRPELRNQPNELYHGLLAHSNVVDVSPDLKHINREDLLRLTVSAGSLVDTKIIEENDALQKQLYLLENITSDLTTDEILDIKQTNSGYQQLTDTERGYLSSVEPFILRDKKEADPNIIIGMQRLNDLVNSPNSHSSTFNSDKLRDDILRGGKNNVHDYLSHVINNGDENNEPMNNWMQKLLEATKEASNTPNVMTSNGYVRIDNQKITMNSGSGNRQDSVSIFNPKSTKNFATSNSNDIGINLQSNPNDINEFLKRYNGANLINYDKQKILINSGDSNYQNKVKITNPKVMMNQMITQEFDSDYLESDTEQEGLAIESNLPLKWEQVETSYKPNPRPGSKNMYKINNMAESNQLGVINHNVYDEQHIMMPNQPTAAASHGSNMLYYGMNIIPQQAEVVNDNQPSLISNDPTAVPENLAQYGSNGFGKPLLPAGIGINNEEELLNSNDPTAVPEGSLYYGMNSVAANQGGLLGTQSTIDHQDGEDLFSYYDLDNFADTDITAHGESIKDSVFDDIQLTEKMKYKGDQTVGGGQGVINNLLQSLTGHEKVIQYTVDSQDQMNLNNNGLHNFDANQGMIEQQNSESSYVAMVGQNNDENDQNDYQQNVGNVGMNSQLANLLAQNMKSTMIHQVRGPNNAAQNTLGYGQGGEVLGQKLVIQTMPVIYKRPFSYQQRINARRPVVVA